MNFHRLNKNIKLKKYSAILLHKDNNIKNLKASLNFAKHQMEVLRSTLEALLIIDNFKESIAFEEVMLIKERR